MENTQTEQSRNIMRISIEITRKTPLSRQEFLEEILLHMQNNKRTPKKKQTTGRMMKSKTKIMKQKWKEYLQSKTIEKHTNIKSTVPNERNDLVS